MTGLICFVAAVYVGFLWLVFRGEACMWCGGRFDGECKCGRKR